MTPELHPRAADRLTKLCGLLTSSHDGERANAAALASRLLTDCGLTWADLVARAFQAPQPPAQLPPHAQHIRDVQWALRFQNRLTDRERKFLTDIGRCRRISAKQAAWLDGIVRKLGGGG